MLNTFGRTWTPRGVLACGGLLVAIAAVFMAANSANAASAPFKVLMVNPFSGPVGGVGKVELAGMKAAANIINSQGGILGSKVEITSKDDAGDGAKATAAAMQEISSTNYNLVFCSGLLASGLPCALAIDNTAPLKIPGIQEASFNKLKRTWGVGVLYDPVEESVVQQLIKKKVKSFVNLTGDNASGRDGARALQAAANRHKKQIKLTKQIFVPVTTADATPYIQQATATGAKAIVINSFTAANVPILRARKKLGVTLPVYTDWYFNSGSLNAATPEERDGVTVQGWPWMFKGNKATRSKSFARFVAEFNKEFGPGAVPLAITAAVTGGNALFLARRAAQLAKSTDPAKMNKQMPKITRSSQVKGYVGPSKLFSKKSRNPKGNPKDWIYLPAGTTGTDGFVVPNQ